VVLAFVVAGAGAMAVIDEDGPGPAIRASAEDEDEEGLGPAEPDDYFLFQRSTRGELPSAEAFTRAVRQARTLRRETVAAAGERVPQWTLEGRPTSAVAWSTW
jgi:hypothetical protein